MSLHDVFVLAVILPLMAWNTIWAVSTVSCPRFRRPEAIPNRFCTACNGWKWPWGY